MATIWILFLMVVQLFNESNTAPATKSVCGNLSLRCVFFLVPSSTELPRFEKFLSNIHSARFLKASEEDERLKVVCDPEDWDEIYRYTVDRKIYFSHAVYCVKKNEYSTHQGLRLGRNRLEKMKLNPSLRNLIGRERPEGQKTGEKKNLLEESTADNLSGVLINGRIRETRAAYRKVKQSGARNKLKKTKSSVHKNSSKTGSKNVYAKNKSKGKERISPRRNPGGRKSLSDRRPYGKLSPKKSGKKRAKKIYHRSVKTESRGSSPIGKSLLRVKKNALNFPGQNNGDKKNIYSVYEDGKITDRGESGVTPLGKRESSLKLSDVVKLATGSTAPTPEKSNNTISRNSKSGKSNGSKNRVKASRSRTVKAKNVTDIPRSVTPSESSNVMSAGDSGDGNGGRKACRKSAVPGAIGISNVMPKRKQKEFNRPDENSRCICAACGTKTVLGGSSTTNKNDAAFERRRDSAHSMDYDLDNIAVVKESIGELADYIYKIFEWVKVRGEIMVAKG